MRSTDELSEDLDKLDALEWNTRLAEEYAMDVITFTNSINLHEYIATSEDVIHSKITHIYGNTQEVTQSNALKLDRVMRKLGALLISEGEVLSEHIMCDFNCEDSNIIGATFKGCVFRNCVFTNSLFQNVRFINSKFIDCDFSNCDFSGTVIAKSQLCECVFNGSRMGQMILSDAIIHSCQFFEVDLDDTHIITSTIHDSNFDNSSMKRVHSMGGIISYSTICNSNYRDSSLIDMSLIDVSFTQSDLNGTIVSDVMATQIFVDEMFAYLFSIDIPQDDIEGDIDDFDSEVDPEDDDGQLR